MGRGLQCCALPPGLTSVPHTTPTLLKWPLSSPAAPHTSQSHPECHSMGSQRRQRLHGAGGPGGQVRARQYPWGRIGSPMLCRCSHPDCGVQRQDCRWRPCPHPRSRTDPAPTILLQVVCALLQQKSSKKHSHGGAWGAMTSPMGQWHCPPVSPGRQPRIRRRSCALHACHADWQTHC